MDNIMLPDDSSNEKNEQSQNFTMNEEMSMEEGMRRNRRATDSSVGRSHGNLSANKIRKNRRDDKIPFTPEVRF